MQYFFFFFYVNTETQRKHELSKTVVCVGERGAGSKGKRERQWVEKKEREVQRKGVIGGWIKSFYKAQLVVISNTKKRERALISHHVPGRKAAIRWHQSPWQLCWSTTADAGVYSGQCWGNITAADSIEQARSQINQCYHSLSFSL